MAQAGEAAGGRSRARGPPKARRSWRPERHGARGRPERSEPGSGDDFWIDPRLAAGGPRVAPPARAAPATLDRCRARSHLQGKGGRASGLAAPLGLCLRSADRRCAAAASRAGPAAPSDAPATEEERGKRITEGRREGTQTAGWFHQTLRAFLQNGQVLEDLHRPSLDPTAEKIAVDVAHPAIEFGPLAGSAFIY